MNRRRGAIVAIIVIAAQGNSACATLSGHRANEPSRVWPTTLTTAQTYALQARFNAADSVLAAFATKYPGTRETLETAYWRSLLKLDPSNPNESIPTAISSLDSYLADARPRDHVVEATTLRRIAGQLQMLNRIAANAAAQVKDADRVAANAKAQAADANARAEAAKEPSPAAEAEIRRLKDELAKAKAELERIRKRLSTPPVKGG